MRATLPALLFAALAAPSTGPLHAQTACDSLEILSVYYAAFTDTAIEVTVQNHSSELFDYPSFRIADQAGDTLAAETINFFGIGWGGPQTHRLDVLPEAQVPGPVFSGSLSLYWITFNDPIDPPCVYTMDFDLCPDSACMSLQAYIYNTGNGIVEATYSWTVTDVDGLVQASGTFTLDANSQQDLEDLCLPPGHYVLSVSDPGPTGGQLQFGLTRSMFMSPGVQAPYLQDGQTDILPFDFFAPCVEGTNAIAERTPPSFTLILNSGALQVRSMDGLALGQLEVMDLHGRTIRRVKSNTGSIIIDLSDEAAGAYLVRQHAPDGWRTQRFVLAR